MNTLKAGLALVAAGALVAGLYGWREYRPQAPPARMPTVVGAPIEAQKAALQSSPYSRAPLSPADLHEKVWSAPDVLAAVLEAQRNGTPDEKLFAADAAKTCFALMPVKAIVLPKGMTPLTPTPEQAKARQELDKRCAGFKSMQWPERHALEDELRSASAASTTDFAVVHAIAGKPHQLSDAETAVVERAFYSGDPLLRREAAYAIAGAMADQAKMVNMLAALYDEVSTPLSTFEALDACINAADRCAVERHAIEPPTPDSATPEQRQALAAFARVRNGIANKAPIRELIASLN
jgi:hypothetical protein